MVDVRDLTVDRLVSHLRDRFGRDTNEATTVANIILPVLERLRDPTTNLEAECRVEIDFGVKNILIDSERHSSMVGRADFFIRDKTSDKVLLVVEAKRPEIDLTEDDRRQLGSYMSAVRPLAPFGMLTNGTTTELFQWKAGVPALVADIDPQLASAEIGLDNESRERATLLLLSISPAYRDDVTSAWAHGELDLTAKPSVHPRAIVSALVEAIHSKPVGIQFVTSPPQCGKSQLLVDLAAELRDTPLVYIRAGSAGGDELDRFCRQFDFHRVSGEPDFVDYLREREGLETACILVDCDAPTNELQRVLAIVARAAELKVHVVVCGSYQDMRELLFFDDFRPRFDPEHPVAIHEIQGFCDDELQQMFPELEEQFLSQPFWRLLRWPGLQKVIREATLPDLDLFQAVGRWFRRASGPINNAMGLLGKALAEDPMRDFLKIPVDVALNADALNALLGAGLAVEVPSGAVRTYRLACIEVGMYAMLSYVFEIADMTPGERQTTLKRHTQTPASEAETIALTALLPYFLCEQEPGDVLKRIVHRIVSISFASSLMEGLNRQRVFSELLKDLALVRQNSEPSIFADDTDVLYRALLRFREQVGMMPDFRETERMLGRHFRKFRSRVHELREIGPDARDMADPRFLKRLGVMTLLDALDLLSKGDTSWLTDKPDPTQIEVIARAIVEELGEPHRSRFPIESRLDYLTEIITRRSPRDLPLLMRQWSHMSGKAALTPHTKRLAALTVDAYDEGHWESLSDSLAYLESAPEEVGAFLLAGLVNRGSSNAFAHVFINQVKPRYPALSPSLRLAVAERLIQALEEIPQLSCFLDTATLLEVKQVDEAVFAKLCNGIESTRQPAALIRLLSMQAFAEAAECHASVVEIVNDLDIADLCSVIATPEFWTLFDAWPGLPEALSARMERGGPGAEHNSTGLFLELLKLLKRLDNPVVPSTEGLGSWTALHDHLSWFFRTSGGLTEVEGVDWNTQTCATCTGKFLQDRLVDGPVEPLFGAIRVALVNIHESVFNQVFVDCALKCLPADSMEVRFSSLKALLVSGFDLWAETVGPHMPALNDLLCLIIDGSDEAIRDELVVRLAEFMVKHSRGLYRLYNFPNYTFRHFCSVEALRNSLFDRLEAVLQAGTAHDGARRLILDLEQILTPHGRSVVGRWVADYVSKLTDDGAEATDKEKWVELHQRLTDEADADATESGKNSEAHVDESDLEAEQERVLSSAPRTPSVLPKWKAETHPRSMLAQLPDGLKRWTIAEFGTSLENGT